MPEGMATSMRNSCFPFLRMLAVGLATVGEAALVWSADKMPELAGVDRFIKVQMADHRIPGLALAITRHGQVVHLRGYGTARDGDPVSVRTQFRLASLSKSFTALAVLQLVEAGRVDLDAPVSRYLPEFTVAAAPRSASATVRQFLHHTSGLADTGFRHGLAGRQNTLAERVVSLRTAHPIDPPGVAFHYFDPNYQVLARLVEVVSGQLFDEYLQTNIFAPLGMRNTVSALTSTGAAQRASHLAQRHLVVYGLPLAAAELSGFQGGSGGVVSTAADMAHYLIAQSDGGQYAKHRVLSPAGIALMQTPALGLASNYAMGWVASHTHGVRTVEHNGVLSTFYAEAVLLPDSGYAFVLLYHEYALASSMVAFPIIKNGVVALLTGQEPGGGKLSMPMLGILLAALTALATGLAIWSLLRLPRWKTRVALGVPRWKLVPVLIWLFAPGILLLILPQLIALLTGRYFGHVMLARAMPEIYILLGISGGLGAITGASRIVHLTWARRTVETR